MTGKYLVRNPLFYRWLCLRERMLPDCSVAYPVPPPRRILVCNGAHLGDVVLATTVLPLLKQTFFGAQIGFLTGSWSQVVLEGHPSIDWIHTYDHWKLNRASIPLWKKLRQHLASRKAALASIREVYYDVAIDLYPHFPNAIPLLYDTGIPYRVGYTSGGYGPLLTHRLDWLEKGQSVATYHSDLLQLLGVQEKNETPSLFFPEGMKLPEGLSEKRYVIFHMGTGNAEKEWPIASWRELAERSAREGLTIVFTGRGEQERRNIEAVREGIPRTINLCDKLSWSAFVFLIHKTALLVSVDSAAGHIASSWKIPSVLLFCGINNQLVWRPVNENAAVLTESVPCAPCFRKRGCSSMHCIRGIPVERVFQEVVRCVS